MNIILYSTSSPRNKVNKSLTQIASINGESNESIGKVNTSFILSKDYIANVQSSNYLYSGVTSKYYFIEDYEIKNQTIRISAKQDVLMNFKTELLNQTCTISRNENISNAYLYDNGYQLLACNNIVTKEFPAGLTGESMILMTVG